MGIPQFTMKQHPKKIIVVLLSGGFIFALGCFICNRLANHTSHR